MNLFEQSPFKEEQETFLRLLDVANVNSLSEKERAIYEENLKNYRDWYATIDYAQTEGIEKGRPSRGKTPDSPKDEGART